MWSFLLSRNNFCFALIVVRQYLPLVDWLLLLILLLLLLHCRYFVCWSILLHQWIYLLGRSQCAASSLRFYGTNTIWNCLLFFIGTPFLCKYAHIFPFGRPTYYIINPHSLFLWLHLLNTQLRSVLIGQLLIGSWCQSSLLLIRRIIQSSVNVLLKDWI